MVDPRYYGDDAAKIPFSELTGSLYRAVAPSAQLYKPEDWNKYEIKLVGHKVNVKLNGTQILDVDLTQFSKPTKRHDDTDAPPLKDRPLLGHIGFQELSRGGGHVEIRNARIKVLD
jgi:hypothetical protein